jgi:hypothetical protein
MRGKICLGFSVKLLEVEAPNLLKKIVIDDDT